MANHQELAERLTARWPEHRIAPSTARIQALVDLLGNPERSAPVVHITGTNGKGSTAAMVDALARSLGLRTGRLTSPHLSDVTERICIDGEPISPEEFDRLWAEIEPMVALVDDQQIDGVAMTFFEVITGLAFAAFADAPVDVMILEVGLGGRWDATNVADAQVAVVAPIDFDHMHILGDTLHEIATEKAGIIKTGASAVIANQQPEAAEVLLERCQSVGAVPVLEGRDFGLVDRRLAVGGQVLTLQGRGGPIGDIHVPLHGEHMAHNAALALAAVESLVGRALEPEVINDGFADVQAPGRLELLHQDPSVVVDTAHNPHGVRATLAAHAEAFGAEPTIAVVAMMADKAIDEVLELIEQAADQIVVTTLDLPRAEPLEDLADRAEGIFGAARVHQAPDMGAALEQAIGIASSAGEQAGVLVIGSVIAAGRARDLLLPAWRRHLEQVDTDARLRIGPRREDVVDPDPEDLW